MSSVLTQREIRKLFTDAVYRRGLAYYKQGYVGNLTFDPARELWKASVRGSMVYQVTIHMDEDGIECDCECPAFGNYSSPCKHVAAVLLKIQGQESGSGFRVPSPEPSFEQKFTRLAAQKRMEEEKRRAEERQRIYTKHITDKFIEAFANQSLPELSQKESRDKEELMVEWICRIHKPFSGSRVLQMEMKAGPKKTYVVRKITGFLNAVRTQCQYEFTKNFTYDPSEHRFSERDKEIIELLLQSVKYEEIYQQMQREHYGNGFVSEERSITISPMLADSFLAKMAEGNVRLEYGGDTYEGVEVHEDELPITLSLNQGSNDQSYQLDLSELLFSEYLALYGYLVEGNRFYKLSDDQQRYMSDLKNLASLNRNPIVMIDNEQMEPFLSHVVPKMNRIGKLKIADEVTSRISNEPLKAKVFVDWDDETLQIQLEYHYGDKILNPFQPDQNADPNQVILIREAGKEQAIMNILESCSLRIFGNDLYLKGEENVYDFLYDTLPKLEDYADIFLTNAVKVLILPSRQVPVTNIEVNSSGNWLDVSFTIEGIAQKDVQNILLSAVEKKKYYRLPDGAFVSLESEEYESIQTMVQEFHMKPSHLKNESLQLPLYRGMQLEEVMKKENGGNAKYGKHFRRLLSSLKNPEQLEFDVPKQLEATLRDYQNYGFQWLSTLNHYRLGGILADDMGLGKTLQSIAFILSEKDRTEDNKPVLIVAPASLVYNWKNEFQKFAPSLKVAVMIGSPQERTDMIKEADSLDVWITSYPTLRQDIEQYAQYEFRTLILDEAQMIKNHATKAAKAVREVRAGTRFALSGTPIENSIDELWSIFQTIMPDFFPNQKAFRQLPPEKVAKMVSPFILRRVKKDVLKELPDKIESVNYSELTKQQKELYLAYLSRIQAEAKESLDGEGFQKSRIKILAGLTRLRQLCCHPSLFLDNYQGESGKLQQLMEIVSNAVENGRRLLIFSQFTSMLSMISDHLNKEGFRFFYLDGKTASKERVQLVDRFNEGEADIFLISLKAGNTGLNLTGADTVILYDLWWNPAVEEQAAGRAHRMGQKKVVQVIRLISQGTIEEKIYELQQSKRELIETVIEHGDQALAKISEEEIREILNI